MKAVCWRRDEVEAVVYTEDREVLRQLEALELFAGRAERGFSTYADRRGKVFAWQASFAAELWPRVTRHLRRNQVIVEERSAGDQGSSSRR